MKENNNDSIYYLVQNINTSNLVFNNEVNSLEFVQIIGDMDIICLTDYSKRNIYLRKYGKRLFRKVKERKNKRKNKLFIEIRHETRVLSEEEIDSLLITNHKKMKLFDRFKFYIKWYYGKYSEWKFIVSKNNIYYKFSLNGIVKIDYNKRITEPEKTHTEVLSQDELNMLLTKIKNEVKETTFSWNIEPTDRSWIITQDGVIRGGINHRAILKRFFTKEWDELKNDSKDDSEIEMLLEERLLNSGMIYVGELTDLYVITLRLRKREIDLIKGFVKSFLLGHKDFENRNISIQIYNGKTKKYKIHKIVADGDTCLCELAKTLPSLND